MPPDPIRDALADAIRSQGMWTTTVKEELGQLQVEVALSEERPIRIKVCTVTLTVTEQGAEHLIEELRKAVRMVRAANAPEPPDLVRVK